MTQALLENGQIKVLFGGRMQNQTQASAWLEWLYCHDKPALKDRANQIHAALRESGYYAEV